MIQQLTFITMKNHIQNTLIALIILLAVSNNVKLTKLLMTYGLNLDYVDEKGRNGLSYTVMSEYTAQMFYFLLSQNIDLKPSTAGLDPLDIALHCIGKFDQAVDFVISLIKHQAPVEKSHLQQLSLLAISKPIEYKKIIEQLPQLKELL